MNHPACWIVFAATTALLFIPGSAGSFFLRRVGAQGGRGERGLRAGDAGSAHERAQAEGSEFALRWGLPRDPSEGLRGPAATPRWAPSPGTGAEPALGAGRDGAATPELPSGTLCLQMMGSCFSPSELFPFPLVRAVMLFYSLRSPDCCRANSAPVPRSFYKVEMTAVPQSRHPGGRAGAETSVNRAGAPEMWLGPVPTACQGEMPGLDPALMLPGQRALHPARLMGEEVTGVFLMMMCTSSSWKDCHPCESRWVSRLGSVLNPTCVFSRLPGRILLGSGRAGRSTAVISAAARGSVLPFAVQGWCVWQGGEVTRVTAGKQLCPQQG